MSRYPVRSWRVVALPRGPRVTWVRRSGGRPHRLRDRPRFAIVAVLDSPFGAVTVAVTHLTTHRETHVRQLEALASAVAGSPRPLVVLGDLNLGPRTATAATGWTVLARTPTYPADDPRAQPDHVLVDGALRASSPARAVATGLSDHRALVVELEPA